MLEAAVKAIDDEIDRILSAIHLSLDGRDRSEGESLRLPLTFNPLPKGRRDEFTPIRFCFPVK